LIGDWLGAPQVAARMMQASEVPDKVTLKVIVLGCSNVSAFGAKQLQK
jgi:hypothetical protein